MRLLWNRSLKCVEECEFVGLLLMDLNSLLMYRKQFYGPCLLQGRAVAYGKGMQLHVEYSTSQLQLHTLPGRHRTLLICW